MERYKISVAVFLILTRTSESGRCEVLLQKRKNTGYMDGMYDVCASGHLEEGESLKEAMIREAKEEINIIVKESDLLFSILCHENKILGNRDYLKVFFKVNNYEGEPVINEVEKCDDLSWFDIEKLPDNIIPSIKEGILNYLKGSSYFEYNF